MTRGKAFLSILPACVLAVIFNTGCGGLTGGGQTTYDVVVLGGTSAGVAAAVQTARMGKSVVLIEYSPHLGGLSSGGLGATDIGNKAAIGGIAREFYERIYDYYTREDAWKYQQREQYDNSKSWEQEKTWWMFEPHVAEQVFNDMVRQAGINVVFGERLDLKNGVIKEGNEIVGIRMESGRVFRGRVFIDATYEGDLMAKAGVCYTVGREANSEYGETYNGVQTRQAVYHQFDKPVDPYVEPGKPESGLLPGVHGGSPGLEGEGDKRVQAYNFRICLTDVPENRLPFPNPAGYDPLRYELLLRYYEAGYSDIPFTLHGVPNRKTDSNNNHAFSTDHIGANYDYPEGDYAIREKIIADHENYQKGLMWTLANDRRVPEAIQARVNRWGLAKDEFTDNGNWPHQLYIREARRMISDYVMTEHNCTGRVIAPNPVGLAAYTMDSHNTQRYVETRGFDRPFARNEGDIQIKGYPPYPISYASIVPKKEECSNLVVPVCLSASHIAFGSIRMEPVFMVLGQSAATAACIAIDGHTSVQDVEYERLRERLLRDGQILEWKEVLILRAGDSVAAVGVR